MDPGLRRGDPVGGLGNERSTKNELSSLRKQGSSSRPVLAERWIPAFAGM